jgi:hypothetical protein
MTDDRFTKEQAEIDQAAAAAPPPPRRTEPCRIHIDRSGPEVTAEEIEEFMKKLKEKE